MKTPEKNDWFIQWLEEKFETLESMIEANSSDHRNDKLKIYKDIEKLDKKHEKKHRDTRWWILAAVLGGSFIWIKETRDIIISLLKAFI